MKMTLRSVLESKKDEVESESVAQKAIRAISSSFQLYQTSVLGFEHKEPCSPLDPLKELGFIQNWALPFENDSLFHCEFLLVPDRLSGGQLAPKLLGKGLIERLKRNGLFFLKSSHESSEGEMIIEELGLNEKENQHGQNESKRGKDGSASLVFEEIEFRNTSSYARVDLVEYSGNEAHVLVECLAICIVEVHLVSVSSPLETESNSFICKKGLSQSFIFPQLSNGQVYEIVGIVILRFSATSYGVKNELTRKTFWAKT